MGAVRTPQISMDVYSKNNIQWSQQENGRESEIFIPGSLSQFYLQNPATPLSDLVMIVGNERKFLTQKE